MFNLFYSREKRVNKFNGHFFNMISCLKVLISSQRRWYTTIGQTRKNTMKFGIWLHLNCLCRLSWLIGRWGNRRKRMRWVTMTRPWLYYRRYCSKITWIKWCIDMRVGRILLIVRRILSLVIVRRIIILIGSRRWIRWCRFHSFPNVWYKRRRRMRMKVWIEWIICTIFNTRMQWGRR